MTIEKRLHDAVADAAPIYGISIGSYDDKASWKIEFQDKATEAERAAALQALSDFDPSQPLSDEKRIDEAFPETDAAEVIFEALFEQANEIRVLKKQSAITRSQYRGHLKTLLKVR